MSENTLTNVSEILRNKQKKLMEMLNDVVDEKTYDQIHTELALLTKSIHIAEVKERNRIAELAEEQRKTAQAAYNRAAKELTSHRQKAKEIDQELFDLLLSLQDSFSNRFDLANQISRQSGELHNAALSLGLSEIPEVERVFVCNMLSTESKFDFFETWIKQFNMSCRALFDAKNNNIPCPDHPGMDWYMKGMGQFFPNKG